MSARHLICGIRGHRWEAEPDRKGGLRLYCPRCGAKEDRPAGTVQGDLMTARDRTLTGLFRQRTQWFPDRTDKP